MLTKKKCTFIKFYKINVYLIKKIHIQLKQKEKKGKKYIFVYCRYGTIPGEDKNL